MTKYKTNNLKELREHHGLTYAEMAKKVGISKCYYWQIEHKNRRLYYDMAKKIAAIFKLKPDDIFFDDN
jgi:putative transcriptional regulator